MGGIALQRAVQVPSALILALNGLVVIFVVSTDRYRQLLRDRDARREALASADAEPANARAPGPDEGAEP